MASSFSEADYSSAFLSPGKTIRVLGLQSLALQLAPPHLSGYACTNVCVGADAAWRSRRMLSGPKQSDPLHESVSLPSCPGCGRSVHSCRKRMYGQGTEALHGWGCRKTPCRERYLWDLLKHS